MRGFCKTQGCPAPKGMCLEKLSNEHLICEHWNGAEQVDSKKSKSVGAKVLPWTGEALQPDELELIGERSSPLVIGMIGCPDAGKTSYLGMLYTLLFNGNKIDGWPLCGSYTLAAWETLAQCLKIKSNGTVDFPIPTPSSADFYSLYHLALKNIQVFRDVLLADSSGEVFNLWSEDVNDENADNARWIYSNSDAFVFFIDSVALVEKRGRAKAEIVQMAEQLAANINNRPVAIVWSKADKISEIKPKIKASLKEDLERLFQGASFFEVTNFPSKEFDPLCHNNNIEVLGNLLNKLNKERTVNLFLEQSKSEDLFFRCGGHANDRK